MSEIISSALYFALENLSTFALAGPTIRFSIFLFGEPEFNDEEE